MLNIKWLLLGRSFAVGMVLAFVVYILSQSDSAFGLGLVMTYLEYVRNSEPKMK